MKKIVLFWAALLGPLSAAGIQDPATYHKNSQMQWDVAMETVARISWTGKERVLDVGCGDGKITALLASRLPCGSILGIDVSQNMVDFAQAQAVLPNLSYAKRDGAELPFLQEFDCIVSFSALHWIMDQKKALAGFYRALVPGGRICLQVYGKYPMAITLIADQLVRSKKWAPYFPSYQMQRVFFTEEEYRPLLEEAGFKDIAIWRAEGTTYYPHRQALVDFAMPLLNFIRPLPEPMQREFVDDVVDEILRLAQADGEGPIRYEHFSLQVVAKKPH